ncbi:MAG: VCBS repeat-containing protein [Phycisphaerae bacterium]|nr:VCBS repeat-containing protein [Phycisphaerae bacterium]
MAQPGLAALMDVINAEAGDYNNDGAPDLVVTGSRGASLWRNERGVLTRADLPAPAREFRAALWIDYDHDYDLDLLLLGETPALLRNQAEAGFAERKEDLPLAHGKATAGLALRVMPDTKSHDFVVTYADRPAVLYRDRLGGRFDVVQLGMIPDVFRRLGIQLEFRGDDIHRLWIRLSTVCGYLWRPGCGAAYRRTRGAFGQVVQREVSTPRPRRRGHQAFEVGLVDESREHGRRVRTAVAERTTTRPPAPREFRPPDACGPWRAGR